MLTIGIDARFAVRERRGIGNYTVNLLRHLALIDRENRYFVYVDCEDEGQVLPRQENFRIKKLRPANYGLWEQLLLPLQAIRDGVQVLHSTGNTTPLFLPSRIRLVSTIHDVMYLKRGEAFPRPTTALQRRMRWYRQWNVRHSVRVARKIITVSEYSKEDILSHLPRLRPEDVAVIPLAPREISGADANPKAFPHGYLFAFGCHEPRKNTRRIIEAFLALKAKQAVSEDLVIAGVHDWRRSPYYKLVADSPCAEAIHFTDYLSDGELLELFRGAKVFLYPSLYEGFGFPPLEAMACGVPVIASNVSAIPEVVGDAALLIEPTDVGELQRAVVQLLGDPAAREALIARGHERVRDFSWKKTAEETLKLYLQVAKDQRGGAIV